MAHTTLAACGGYAYAGSSLGHGPGLDKWKPKTRLKRSMQLAINAGSKTKADKMLPVTIIFRPLH